MEIIVVILFVLFLIIMLLEMTLIKRLFKYIEDVRNLSSRYQESFFLTVVWIKAKQEGKSIEQYLMKHNYRTIAIYGMGLLGERLLEELWDTDVVVSYAVDRNAQTVYSYIDIYTPDIELSKVDAVIVTTTFVYHEVKQNLEKKMKCPIISLSEVLRKI